MDGSDSFPFCFIGFSSHFLSLLANLLLSLLSLSLFTLLQQKPKEKRIKSENREKAKEGRKTSIMLGKRARQPMRRTTSMTEFAFDPSAVHVDPSQPSDPAVARQRAAEARRYGGAGSEWLGSRHVAGHRNRRNSADFASAAAAPFLRACGLCKRSLGPGRDTFMYRGEVAFCSLECRQQQMNLDERKDKCALTSGPAQAASEQSTNGETVAAA
ncbi:hypothetical protein LUZ61_004225 [Rhynchospora tenuis]|uniref:FLZ-type domain-containing protein n=1 Tax=Rhynchospora tenuis TaxID=198213 RepID=A0AAD5ZM96_9POAL|nr:hypothetical protein LUZ61_004225 [Rhynchospora tenuis]